MATRIYILHFPKETSSEPNIYQLVKQYDIEFNILKADILPQREGVMILELKGPQEKVKKGLDYLKSFGVKVKRLAAAIKRDDENAYAKGYDYVIIDRCAGTGNLQKELTDGELSHCILNTYVYAEWTTLKGLYEDRVRHIIPHTKDHKDPDGLLSNGDALTEEFNKTINNS